MTHTVPDEAGVEIFERIGEGNIVALKRIIHKYPRLVSIHKNTLRQQTPLWEVCYFGNEKMAEILLQSGAPVNQRDARGETPLFVASYHGRLKLLEILLKYNADVNIPDYDGYTPLFMAASCGHVKVVKLLLENQALVNLRPNVHLSVPPLVKAITSRCPAVVELLLEYGAEVNWNHTETVTEGSQALKEACRTGDRKIIKKLLSKGAILPEQDPEFWMVANRSEVLAELMNVREPKWTA